MDHGQENPSLGRASLRVHPRLLDCKLINSLHPSLQVPQVALVIKNLPANAGEVRDAGPILGWEGPLEKETAAHSRILAWRISQTEEPCGLQLIGSHRVGHI